MSTFVVGRYTSRTTRSLSFLMVLRSSTWSAADSACMRSWMLTFLFRCCGVFMRSGGISSAAKGLAGSS